MDAAAVASNFNPRSPHGERPTEELTDPDGESYISIHAPRTGSDPSMWTKTATSENFNPRSPHGERRWSLSGVRGRSDFNPRSPHGERQHATCPLLSSLLISIHAPRTGSDGNEKQTPHPEKISIHAPRTGSDLAENFHGQDGVNFNPRSPHGERRHPHPRRYAQHHFNPRSPHGERRL